MALLMDQFGINEWSARILSVIYGTLTIILIFFTCKKFSNDNIYIGLAAALIYALSIWSIAWAREARFYQQYQFFSLLLVYFFYLGYIEGKSGLSGEFSRKIYDPEANDKYKYLSVLVFVFTVLSSNQAILLVAPLFFIFIITKRWKNLFSYSTLISLSFIIVIWLIIQALPILFSINTKNPAFETDIVGFDPQQLGPNMYSIGVIMAANFIMFLLIFLGLTLKNVRENKAMVFLYSYILIIPIIFIITISGSHIRGRYLYFIFPLIVIACCYSMYHISHFLADHRNYMTPKAIKQYKYRKGVSKRYFHFNKAGIIILFIIMILIVDSKVYVAYDISSDPYSGTKLSFGQVPWHPDYEGSCGFILDNYQDGDCVLTKRHRPVDFYLNDFIDRDNAAGNITVIEYHDINMTYLQWVFDNYRVWVLIDQPLDTLIPDSISQSEYDYIKSQTTIMFFSKDDFTRVRLEST